MAVKIRLPWRQSSEFNDVSYQFYLQINFRRGRKASAAFSQSNCVDNVNFKVLDGSIVAHFSEANWRWIVCISGGTFFPVYKLNKVCATLKSMVLRPLQSGNGLFLHFGLKQS